MAPRSSSSTARKVPLSRFTIALLLAKSKPAGFSADYLSLLKAYIKDEPRLNHARNSGKHVDATAFWRDAYTRSEETQIELRARISELEKQLRERYMDKSPSLKVTLRKRKRGALEASGNSDSRSPKQAKKGPSTIAQEVSLDSISRGSVRSVTDDLGNDFLHYLYTLQEILAQKDPTPQNIVATLRYMSLLIRRLTSTIQYSEEAQIATAGFVANDETTTTELAGIQTRARTEGEIREKILAVGHVFPNLTVGLHRLSQLPGGKALEFQVIYDFVEIFKYVIERICTLSTARAKKKGREKQTTALRPSPWNLRSTENQSNEPPKLRALKACLVCTERKIDCDQRTPKCRYCSKRKLKCEREPITSSVSSSIEKDTMESLGKTIISLCELAIKMMASLDTTKATHKQVLEGFLYFLFERVGMGLKRFVFGAEGQEFVPARIGNKKPQEKHADMNNEKCEDDEAIEAQAPYLIWMLEHAQAVLSQQRLPNIAPNPLENLNDRPAETRLGNSKNSMAAFAREQLQHTLLKSVFGDEASKDFDQAVSPPQAPNLAAEFLAFNMPVVDVEDWFKHEVWRIVGWDVLREYNKGW